MKNLNLKILFLLMTFFAQTIFAKSSLEAYKLIKEKKWREANEAASKATKNQPNDAEAWFLLGLTEERLENLSDAIDAYEKYLKLNPAPSAVAAVEARIADLKPRARQQAQDKYGKFANGLFVEKSLMYKPSFVTEIGGKLNTPFSFGFRIGMVTFGYRRASGTYSDNIQAPTTTLTKPAYATIRDGGTITHQQIFANINFSLVDPYTSWGNMQLTLPLSIGGFNNSLKANYDGKKYGNGGLNLGLGLGLVGYTRSPFSWYVQSIYHYGIPYWPIRETGSHQGIKNSHGDAVKGNNINLEVAAGITFLFGEKLTKHY